MAQDCKQNNKDSPKLSGYEFYKSIGSPRFICAPMVEQSELPFRLLCLKYGVSLCYSPMINSKQFMSHPRYTEAAFQTCHEDRPLIAQLCGHDADILLKAAQQIQDRVDAVDINFGCPQAIARRGYYGAFLLNDIDLMCSLVNTLYLGLNVPVCAKIRILDDDEDTISMCKRLESSGCSILSVHGRTIHNKKQVTTNCNFKLIKRIKNELSIPVFANGGCETYDDVVSCLNITGCDGYMAAESLLNNPSMFNKNKNKNNKQLNSFQIARDYIDFVQLCLKEKNWFYRNLRAIKGHLFKIFNRDLNILQDIRNKLGETDDIEWILNIVNNLQDSINKMNINSTIKLYEYIYNNISTNNYYFRHRRSAKEKDSNEIWQIILKKCPKPIEKHSMQLIKLLIKYDLLNIKQCKEEIILNINDRNKILIELKQEEQEAIKNKLEKQNNKNNNANIINSMFGTYEDDDDSSLSEHDSITDTSND